MTNYRVATKDGKFTVQKRTFFGIWVLFEYGVNEGGGSYIILEDTIVLAKAKFHDALKFNSSVGMGSQSGWTAVENL